MPLQLTIAENLSLQTRPVEPAYHPRLLRGARILFAALFFVGLFVPLVGSRFHWDPAQSSENRVMARLPDLPKNSKQLRGYSDLFLAWYRDHFGFRNTLIRSLSLAKFHGGLAMDQGTGIIIGAQGWLFYPSQARNFLADRNLDPFTSADLDTWQRILEQRNKFCADHQIPFIVVIPPNKQDIYPEYIPEEYSTIGPQSRLDQLIERLRQTNSPVHIVDLRPALLKAKKLHRVYFKTDTHWNDFGGYAAYPVILDAVNRALPGARLIPQPLSNFTIFNTTYSGDLAYFINLYYEYREDREEIVRNPPFPQIVDMHELSNPVITTGENPQAPALFMIHDSYTLYLSQFLGPNFSRVAWQWTDMMEGPRILAFKPDIVIDEFLERMLFSPPPVDSADVRAIQPR